MKKKNKDILILGLGNILKGDEGVGVHVINALKKEPLPVNIELIDGGTAGLAILPFFSKRKKIIIIDAIQSKDKVGTIYRFSPSEVKFKKTPLLSLHQLKVPDLLDILTLMDENPPPIVILGIKGKDYVNDSLELTEEIKTKIPQVIKLIKEEINA